MKISDILTEAEMKEISNPLTVSKPDMKMEEDEDNPYAQIDLNKWHLIQNNKPIAINFESEHQARSFHSGHGYGSETKIEHGSRVRRNPYIKRNPEVINWPVYSQI
ncbi:MAG TPA: hypothetical protein VFM18_17280 [Methanosarcina sp.]|nr:hypothetical protein [Methanosarcina sp.]